MPVNKDKSPWSFWVWFLTVYQKSVVNQLKLCLQKTLVQFLYTYFKMSQDLSRQLYSYEEHETFVLTSFTMSTSGIGNLSAAILEACLSHTKLVLVHNPFPLGSGIPAGLAFPNQMKI